MGDQIEIYVVNMDEKLNTDEYDKLLSYLSEKKRERIDRFHRFEDAQRTLMGDILARYLVCRKLKIRVHEIEFSENEYHKPYLANYEDIHFNVSHSGKWVVCCFHDLHVGIDIEQIRPVDFSIAKRFFSEEEYAKLKSMSVEVKESFFYDIWTLKESYIKAVGRGMHTPLGSFTVRIEENQITVWDALSGHQDYFLRQYDIDEAYKMAVCAKKDAYPAIIEQLCISELYKKIRLYE